MPSRHGNRRIASVLKNQTASGSSTTKVCTERQYSKKLKSQVDADVHIHHRYTRETPNRRNPANEQDESVGDGRLVRYNKWSTINISSADEEDFYLFDIRTVVKSLNEKEET